MTSEYRQLLLDQLVGALEEVYSNVSAARPPRRDLWRGLTDEQLAAVYNSVTAARVQARLNATYAPATDPIERFR